MIKIDIFSSFFFFFFFFFFLELPERIEQVLRIKDEEFLDGILIGNKSDLEDQRQVLVLFIYILFIFLYFYNY